MSTFQNILITRILDNIFVIGFGLVFFPLKILKSNLGILSSSLEFGFFQFHLWMEHIFMKLKRRKSSLLAMPHCIRNQGLWLSTCGDTVGRHDCSLIQLCQALSKDYALRQAPCLWAQGKNAVLTAQSVVVPECEQWQQSLSLVAWNVSSVE